MHTLMNVCYENTNVLGTKCNYQNILEISKTENKTLMTLFDFISNVCINNLVRASVIL